MLQFFQTLIKDHIILDKHGPEVKVHLRHSKKARRVSIRITAGTAHLVLPEGQVNAGYKFLLQKENWIRQKLNQISRIIQAYPAEEGMIPIFGQKYVLKHTESSERNVKIAEEEGVINIHSPASQQHDILINFLNEKLLTEITLLTGYFREKYDLNFSKIRITDNKSRWGSCSSKGVLAFNRRIVFAPKEILRYLVVHEMCHLLEMNHSARFWNLVAKLDPDYQTHRNWLKMHGPRLHHYLKDFL